MIEKNFDISFIADLALREKQIQQNYRPIIAVHKWFARRPGTLFRGLLLAEFSNSPLNETFYKANSLKGILVADPFMGGGTPLLEANRIGCNVIGFDINPMSCWIVKQEIEHLDLKAYDEAAESLSRMLESEIGHLYHTECVLCGKKDVPVKYFLRVKVIECRQCRKDIDLFPGYLISTDRRHPKNVFLCFRKTKRAERIQGFDQAPDFIIPSEFNPQIIIEAKITEDDGTARDKVTRIQHLGESSLRDRSKNTPKYEVIACIGGRGFGVRREDMKKMILATRGKVFTVKTLDRF
ncbi:MAG: DUF1156 domain-containing protein [Deltaproteobacteria bacterium]|nr:DUF1156 domain-containing protein [Deltaproteobacteria bacterium]